MEVEPRLRAEEILRGLQGRPSLKDVGKVEVVCFLGVEVVVVVEDGIFFFFLILKNMFHGTCLVLGSLLVRRFFPVFVFPESLLV